MSSTTTKSLFKLSYLSIVLSASLLNATPATAADTIVDGGQTVTVPGTQTSPWNLGNNSIYIGQTGNGALIINNSGVVENKMAFIGDAVGSTGRVEVSGIGSQWNNSTKLYVGHSGNGSLAINDGGVASSYDGHIGHMAGSTGLVEVSGTGSQWNNDYFLYVGYAGDASLTINDGGMVSSNGSVIGLEEGSSGIISISGVGSRWNNQREVHIGYEGNAKLTVSDGGFVSSYFSVIGNEEGSSGIVSISGVGSQWNNQRKIYIGYYGNGSLTISDRAEVSAGPVYMAVGSTGVGTLNIGNGNQSGTFNAESITGGDGSATVNFNHTDDIDFSPPMSGFLTVNQMNQGTTTLTSANDYAGVTTVSAGTLKAGAAWAFSAASDFTVKSAGQLNLAGYDQAVASLNNSGIVSFNGAPGAVLTVSGDYTGNNGLLNFNTALSDDSSATDKLVVTGNTAGVTRVSVTNVGGSGAVTLNGIELIQVNGTSGGEFVQQGRIVAGAYDYSLVRGADVNAGNWYLTSKAPESTPNPTPENNDPLLRPEAGSYLANMAAAGKLFNLRLEDREGRAENSSMWLRQQGSRTKFRDTSGQIKTATNSYVVQGGGEVAETRFTDADRLGVGLMLGYGEADSQSSNRHSGYHSKGKVDGYSAGVYATWYQDAKTLNGVYVDSWVQYSWLNGEVHGEQLSGERYDINGLSASVESGYRIPVYQSENGAVFVTPQAQIIWSGIKADDHTETNGTRVTSDSNNNVQTRLGVKLSRDGVSNMDKNSDKLFTVYAEANWLHNTEQAGAVMDGVTMKQAGNSNVGELKLGAEGQLNKHANLWTNVAQQLGDDGYSDTLLTVGFKYTF
ncbi:autotransporter outer membrane beta-barrel domain-containing protein [Budvicia diplopodorum]|uniref:autotransporter family protein n=1 Tax=Budvicia diplopodorum TaxID=1119056 RepID=UPI00135B6E23|nr:autotransporter outer membrane beta-barrel domain-containing protein [Budvicia diplopodorum]